MRENLFSTNEHCFSGTIGNRCTFEVVSGERMKVCWAQLLYHIRSLDILLDRLEAEKRQLTECGNMNFIRELSPTDVLHCHTCELLEIISPEVQQTYEKKKKKIK